MVALLFNSAEFLLFFPVVCLLYFPLPQVLKKPWLLVCSYYFYMCWDARFALLILASTLSTWLCGFLLDRAVGVRARKLALAANLLLNLGLLFFFKYFDFFSASLTALFAALGLRWQAPLLGLTLPVGISFYTLQALGYSIDVYRKKLPHEKSLLNYALFVSFFPQLVAGPIERAQNFLPQLRRRVYFEERRVEEGLVRMLIGFFKKVVVAEGAAVIVNLVYADPARFSAPQLVLATVLFAIQLYCDFAGYSDIAVGAACVLGYRLMRNFDRPYFSTNIAQFWRRWHISLSFWLRDYLYIPLGGNRRGLLRKQLNLLVTFAVSGLWHGANWTFVVWGALNGLYQVLQSLATAAAQALARLLRLQRPPLLQKKWGRGLALALPRALGMVMTFTLVCFTYIFFRASSLQQAGLIIDRIAAGSAQLFRGAAWQSALQGLDVFGGLPLCWGSLLANTGVGLGVCLLLLTLLDVLEGPNGTLAARLCRCWFPLRWAFCLVLLGCILLYGSFAPSGFYYFQF